jgi:hypothetical protein
MADEKEPFPRWVIRYMAVPVVVALITGGILFARRDSGDGGNDKPSTSATAPPTTSDPPIALPPGGGGTDVRACMVQHGMSRAVTTATTLVEARKAPGEEPQPGEQDTATVLQRCEWPPKPWSDPDGYSQISVQATLGPGESEASDANTADIIKSPCRLLEVVYSIAAQGHQESFPEGKWTSKPSRAVYYFKGEEYRDELNFYYDHDELVVLRNSKVRLDRVRCVK